MMNPFRTASKRRQFQMLVDGYARGAPALFNPDGSRNYGNSFIAHFWAGYDGIDGGRFRPSDIGYRTSGSYVFYRAGQECRKVDA
jgi:hypothetical protein